MEACTVKLYSHPVQPNAIRVLMFLDEKGLDLPITDLDLLAGEHKSPAFLKKNPSGQVPTLELDDGACLTESLVICRYLDQMFGKPRLFGEDIESQAFVSMWERILELGLFIPAVEYGHHTIPEFAPFFDQNRDWAESLRPGLHRTLDRLDERLGNHRFVTGDDFSVADITGFLGATYAEALVGLRAPSNSPLERWLREVSDRAGARSAHRAFDLWPDFRAAVGRLTAGS
jgi:glutathione S-transferase